MCISVDLHKISLVFLLVVFSVMFSNCSKNVKKQRCSVGISVLQHNISTGFLMVLFKVMFSHSSKNVKKQRCSVGISVLQHNVSYRFPHGSIWSRSHIVMGTLRSNILLSEFQYFRITFSYRFPQGSI